MFTQLKEKIQQYAQEENRVRSDDNEPSFIGYSFGIPFEADLLLMYGLAKSLLH